MLDFNTAPRQATLQVIDPQEWDRRIEALREALRHNTSELVREIFPAARHHGSEARVGNAYGDPGESLSIGLAGERAGLWFDHATGEGGDLIDLWKASTQADFMAAVEDLERWCGIGTTAPRWASPVAKVAAKRKEAAAKLPRADDRLPPPTASWHYLSADGALLGIVRRYDLDAVDAETGKRKKTFRPFTASGEPKMPDPRPLYRLPQIKTATTVVLVEGEKCADALERVGVEATTAMGGAKADPGKTDWSPLAGKAVVVWEDNDAAGSGLAERVRPHLEAIGCTVTRLTIPAGKPEKWDAADAVEEGEDVATILAAATPQPAPAPRFRFLTLRELRDLKPPEWRIDGVLPVHGSSVIYGAYESFKTFVALDMLLSLACGREWMGHATKPCGVIYIAGEGQHGISPRTTGWLSARGLDDDQPFLVLPQAVAIPTPADIDALCEAIDGLPFRPGIIALDTVTRMSGGGSLNDEKDVQSYVRGMDALRLRTGAHIMNIGHSGKNKDSGLFGSVVLPGAVETIICVERKGMCLKLVNEGPKGKQKDGPNFRDIALAAREVEFDQGGMRSKTLILSPDDQVVTSSAGDDKAEPAQHLGPTEQRILAALGQAAAAGQGLGFTRLKMMVGSEIQDSGFAKALKRLTEKGLIRKENDAWVRA